MAVIVDNLARTQAAANATKPKRIPALHKPKVSSKITISRTPYCVYTPTFFFQRPDHESEIDLAGKDCTLTAVTTFSLPAACVYNVPQLSSIVK